MNTPRLGWTDPVGSSRPPLIRSATIEAGRRDAAELLAQALGQGPFALIILFISPLADMAALTARLDAVFPDTPVMGCTTAGEIGSTGYAEGQIVAVALPSAHFEAEALLVPDLDDLSPQALISQLIRVRQGLIRARPDWQHEFAFLLVDGLSIREDELTGALASGLGPVPLFGGSAGDGTRFRQTFVLQGGQMHDNAAVLVKFWQENGGRLKLFPKEGGDHHPHGLPDPKPLIDLLIAEAK